MKALKVLCPECRKKSSFNGTRSALVTQLHNSIWNTKRFIEINEMKKLMLKAELWDLTCELNQLKKETC